MVINKEMDEIIDLLDAGKELVLSNDELETISLVYRFGRFYLFTVDWMTFERIGIIKATKMQEIDPDTASKYIERSTELYKEQEETTVDFDSLFD